jgi:hypothetical protein
MKVMREFAVGFLQGNHYIRRVTGSFVSVYWFVQLSLFLLNAPDGFYHQQSHGGG